MAKEPVKVEVVEPKEEPEMIDIDILDMEMSQNLPHWLDPQMKYKGKHDEKRRLAQKARSEANMSKREK